MTLKIPRLQAGSDFEVRVEAFRQAKLAHHKTIGVSAPCEHPLIEAAIKRVPGEELPDDYVADYEIIEQTLDEKKRSLVAEVGKAEQAALAKSMPEGKRRLLSFQFADALAKSNSARTVADVAAIQAWEAVDLKDQVIQRYAAKLHAQIDDLTEETVKTWKLEPFPDA